MGGCADGGSTPTGTSDLGGSVSEADDRGKRVTSPKDMPQFAILASRVRAGIVFILLDLVCVIAGYGLAEVTYFRDRAPAHYWMHFSGFLLVAVVVTLASNRLFGLYGRMWRHAGADEARQLVLSTAFTLFVLMAFWPIGRSLKIELVPPIVVVVGCMFTSAGMGVLRFHSRLFAWQRGSKRLGLRVAVIGSRDTGAAAIREMLRSPGAGLVPVAVFDDDPRAHGLSLLGVPVVGRIADIPEAASRYTIQQVLLAIPSPPPEMVERALRSSEIAGISMKILPGVKEMLNEPAHIAAIRQAREPRIEDLLGRTPVPTDLETVRRSVAGRRVLVTGAGGSIGSEICRQVASLEPALLVLLDHDETHLHDAAATLVIPCEQTLVDVTDRAAVFEAFEHFRPEVVFHAAAHKHVPVLEQHPLEAAKTNVLGTLNVVDAAAVIGTTRFVQISTDKAVHPSSVMGASKRLAEQTVLSRAPQERCLLHREVRKRARQSRKRDSHLRPTDRPRRSGDGHRPPDDQVLHECRGSGPTRAAVVGDLVRWRDLHARDGQARTHPRPGRTHDPTVRLPGGDRHPDRNHRNTAGREAQRGPQYPRRAGPQAPATPTSTGWFRSRRRQKSSQTNSNDWRKPSSSAIRTPCEHCCSRPERPARSTGRTEVHHIRPPTADSSGLNSPPPKPTSASEKPWYLAPPRPRTTPTRYRRESQRPQRQLRLRSRARQTRRRRPRIRGASRSP